MAQPRTESSPAPPRPRQDEPVLGPLPHALLQHRHDRALTAAQAGALVGVGRSTWRGWESGVIPTPSNLAKLAEVLGVTPTEARALAGADRVRRPGAFGDAGSTGMAAARQALGFTATSLARQVHVSVSCLSRWESGERVPDARTRVVLAAALQMSLSELDSVLGHRPAPSQVTQVPGLRNARLAAGITQRALAKRLSVDASTVRRWEVTGTAPAQRARELEAALGPGVQHSPAAPCQPAANQPPVMSALKRIRRRRGLGATVVAGRVGVSVATVWAWERGTRRPGWHSARRLAQVLGCPVADVFAAVGLSPPSVMHQERWSSSDVPRAMKELRRWNGLTQHELARHLGVAAGTVAGWQRGRYKPRTRSLQSLLSGLPVRIEE